MPPSTSRGVEGPLSDKPLSPWARRLVWRLVYDFIARRYRTQELTFMNYGYRPPAGEPLLALEPAEESDRSGIELYRLVTRGVELCDKDVLEIGSGRGGGTAFIARHFKPARTVGVDRSREAVELSRVRLVVSGLDFEVGDAEQLSLPDASFDAVINVESSHCYGDLRAFLGEVRRVLRPGGFFLYADFRPRIKFDQWRAGIGAAGFEIVSEREITAGVLAALDADHDRKLALIETRTARWLHGALSHFAGLRGTGIYEDFRSGSFGYWSFVCVRAEEAPHARPRD